MANFSHFSKFLMEVIDLLFQLYAKHRKDALIVVQAKNKTKMQPSHKVLMYLK